MIAYLIGPVELRLGVDDGGRVLVQRRHELRQARGLLGEGLLGRGGPHPAPAASPSAGAARSLANHLSDKLTGASLHSSSKSLSPSVTPSLTRARHTGPPARAKLAYESIVVGRSGGGDVVGEGVHATPHGVEE